MRFPTFVFFLHELNLCSRFITLNSFEFFFDFELAEIFSPESGSALRTTPRLWFFAMAVVEVQVLCYGL